MLESYEQMELDTRKEVDRAATQIAVETISAIRTMIDSCGEAPNAVRNRHEAYGIAAEHLAKIGGTVKSIKNDCATLLGTLADPNFPAVEAVSSIVNSTTEAATIMLIAAAEMRRTLDNLYLAESQAEDRAPLDDCMAGSDGFEEVESTDADGNE